METVRFDSFSSTAAAGHRPERDLTQLTSDHFDTNKTNYFGLRRFNEECFES